MIVRRGGLVAAALGSHFLAPHHRRLLHFGAPLSCLAPLLPRRRSNLRLCSSSLRSGDMAETRSPPAAKKVEHVMQMFGDVRVDNYYWLRDDSRCNPDMLSYLREENDYTGSVMSGTKEFENKLFAEIRGRIKEDDISAPLRKGPYYYYKKNLQGKEYVQHCRRLIADNKAEPSVYDTMPTGPDAPPEHIILDENIKAQEFDYYSIGAFKASPDHKLVAYAEDTKGDEIYTVNVIDSESLKQLGQPLKGLTCYLEWAGNDALVYITMDEILRPDKVWLHKLGTEQSSDVCLYHEKDDMFSLDLHASESHKYIFVASESKTTRFVFSLDVSKPQDGLKVLTPRVDGIDSSVSHRGNHFFIQRRSTEFYNSELVACSVDDTSKTTVLIPHRESVKIQEIQLFRDHLAVFEREQGLQKITVHRLPAEGQPLNNLQAGRSVSFVDPVYSIDSTESEFASSVLRFRYSSMKTPPSVYDYDMDSGTSVIKKIDTVLGGFDASNYVTERKWVTAADGTQVPMSIVYNKNLAKLDGFEKLQEDAFTFAFMMKVLDMIPASV
ncbi:hypothetical protein BRARA_F00314 [Brassica rapa]|uniref:Peptidase S9A N-terminal domain-containing protein n=1 Tax=Brassica campestris TaxID=3711 RepID=A0A397YWA4_BRACM|nr:hypothetical protein BRARA_F00314 [Brassica rapa]